MNSAINDYYSFIEVIVKNDLDEVQQSIFDLDGRDLVEQMFSARNSKVLVPEKASGMEYSLAPDVASTIAKIVVDVGTLLVSTFTLYLQFKKYSDEQTKERKTELQQLWKDELIKNNVAEAEAERLARKYASDLERLLK